MKLQWKKRAKRVDTELARRRLWASTCGRYHVMEAISNYKLPTCYYALGASLGGLDLQAPNAQCSGESL